MFQHKPNPVTVERSSWRRSEGGTERDPAILLRSNTRAGVVVKLSDLDQLIADVEELEQWILGEMKAGRA